MSETPKKPAYIPRIARCNRLAGNGNAGTILYRLAYWMPKTIIVHKGRKWIARSRAELAEETGLSFQQTRDGIDRLRRLGLIQTEQHLFDGRKVLHLLVPAYVMENVCQDGASVPNDTDPSVPNDTDPSVPNGTDHIQGALNMEANTEIIGELTLAFGFSENKQGFGKDKNITKDTQDQNHPSSPETSSSHKKTRAPASQSAKAQPPEPVPSSSASSGPQKASKASGLSLPTPKPQGPSTGVKSASPSKPKGKVHASSVAEAIQNAKSPASMGKAHKPEKLAAHWVKALAKAINGYVPPLTVKERAMLKALEARCPPGRAADVIDVVLGDWIGFTVKAGLAAGVKTTPNEPRLDFLLKHVGFASNMLPTSQPPAAAPASAVKPDAPAAGGAAQSIAKLPPKPQDPDDLPPASLAELNAIIYGD